MVLRATVRRVGAAALAIGWSSACGPFEDMPIEDLGSTNDGLSTAEPTPTPGPEILDPPIPGGKDPVPLDPGFEGRWGGYAENPFRRDENGQVVPAVFPFGSSDVTLDYRFEGPLLLPQATLIFGTGPAPLPERGFPYPAGVSHYFATTDHQSSGGSPGASPSASVLPALGIGAARRATATSSTAAPRAVALQVASLAPGAPWTARAMARAAAFARSSQRSAWIDRNERRPASTTSSVKR
jgi:hypothetical protein